MASVDAKLEHLLNDFSMTQQPCVGLCKLSLKWKGWGAPKLLIFSTQSKSLQEKVNCSYSLMTEEASFRVHHSGYF